MNLIEHLETGFGKINRGWSGSTHLDKWPFQVAEFVGGQFNDVISFSTIGLSNHELKSRVSDNLIRQELFFQSRNRFVKENSAAVLYEIGMLAINSQEAFLRGDIIDQFDGIVFEGSNYEGFYVACPVYYDDSFASCTLSENARAAICWLIPITGKEILYTKLNGWEKFEERIAEKDPDFFSFDREEVV